MANRFSVTPLGGMDVGTKLTNIIEGGRKQNRLNEWNKTAPDIIKGGNPSEIAGLMTKYPEMQQNIMAAAGYEDTALLKESIDLSKEILSGTSDPKQALAMHIQQGQARGEDVTRYMNLLGREISTPGAAKEWADKWLAMGDSAAHKQLRGTSTATSTQKEYAQAQQQGFKGSLMDYKQQVSGKDTGDKLTTTQKDYKLAKEEGFAGSYVDYRKAVSGSSAKNELEMAKLTVQIADIQDRVMARKEKTFQTEEKAQQKSATKIAGIDNVIAGIEETVKLAEEGFLATGIGGAVTSKIPGSPSYNLRKKVGTIKANIGFDRLQQMRDMSPTGGALGQVAVQELDALQNSIAALDPNMGEEELIAGLRKVANHYKAWKDTLAGDASINIKYVEGQKAIGPGGQKLIFTNGSWRSV
jgi:hypothetical protein